VVAWLPSPRETLGQLDQFLDTFQGESLGDQVNAIRYDWQRQLGFDPFDPKTLGNLGFDPEQPWAIASGKDGFIAIVATTDSGTAGKRLRVMAKENLGATQERQSGNVTIFGEPFGSATIDTFAMRDENKALLVAFGKGCGDRLQAWPSAEALSSKPVDGKWVTFQQWWKKAESDGSIAGAAARVLVRGGSEIPYLKIPLPPGRQNALREGGQEEVQLRGTLLISPQRIELMGVVLGLDPQRVRDWMAPEQHVIGAGLPAHPLVWGRSTLKPQPLVHTARQLFGPLVGLIDKQLGTGELEHLIALGNGNAELAVELNANAPTAGGRTPAERAASLLDMLPLTATADLSETNAFDALLPRLEKGLTDRGVKATLDTTQVPAVLRAP